MRDRELKVLNAILKNIKKLQKAKKLDSVDKLDLFAFYISQIGSLSKRLTKTSRQKIFNKIDYDLLIYWKNKINHEYNNVYSALIIEYAKALSSKMFYTLVLEQRNRLEKKKCCMK